MNKVIYTFATLIAVFTKVSSSAPYKLNGWYSCDHGTHSLTSFGPLSSNRSEGIFSTILPKEEDRYRPQGDQFQTECAQLQLPYCYPNVCSTNSTVDKTIPVFVKRLLGNKSTRNPALWLLPGGPGEISTDFDSFMVTLQRLFDGHIDVYTLDHRGVGRSHQLTCEAAQLGQNIEDLRISSLFECADDISFQIETPAAFSVTSAALDLKNAIDAFNLNVEDPQEVYIYGASYGTYLAGRYLQVVSNQAKGVILDSVVSQQGNNDERMTFTRSDEYLNMAAIEYFKRCADNSNCSSILGSDPIAKVEEFFRVVDDGYCPGIFGDDKDMEEKENGKSIQIKQLFAQLLRNQEMRSLIPPFIYRMRRCSSNDVHVLSHFTNVIRDMVAAAKAYEYSTLGGVLSSLIVASELWQIPTPSYEDISGILNHTLVATNEVKDLLAVYCVFGGDHSPNCANHINRLVKEENATFHDGSYLIPKKSFSYIPDKYFNKTADLTNDTVSVLLLSGRMDTQTPHRYAEIEARNLKGNIKLISFNYSSHITFLNTPIINQNFSCAAQIIRDYILAKGDLNQINETCIDSITPMMFDINPQMSEKVFGTADAYDGTIAQVAATGSSTISMRTFIACVTGLGMLLGFCLIAVGLLARHLMVLQAASKEERACLLT